MRSRDFLLKVSRLYNIEGVIISTLSGCYTSKLIYSNKRHFTGLKVTASRWILSGQNSVLTGQMLHWLVMLPGTQTFILEQAAKSSPVNHFDLFFKHMKMS